MLAICKGIYVRCPNLVMSLIVGVFSSNDSFRAKFFQTELHADITMK